MAGSFIFYSPYKGIACFSLSLSLSLPLCLSLPEGRGICSQSPIISHPTVVCGGQVGASLCTLSLFLLPFCVCGCCHSVRPQFFRSGCCINRCRFGLFLEDLRSESSVSPSWARTSHQHFEEYSQLILGQWSTSHSVKHSSRSSPVS